ncbi:MAG: hypothetical protein WCS03_02750 [Bacteroidota bacterium]
MERFLKRSFLFCVVVIFCVFICTILIIEINRILFGKIKIENEITTIILGDSHTECAINDSIMSETRNVSLLSEGYFFSYLKLENIIDNNDNLKNVILGFSYHNLSIHYDQFVYGTPTFSSISRYVPLMNFRDILTLLSKQSSITNLTPIIKSSLSNILKYSMKGNPCILKDNIPDISEGVNNESIKKRINFLYYSEGEPCKVSNFNLFYLKKIVELCKGKDINIILINTPLFEDFYAVIPSCKINEYDAIVNDLDIPYINLNSYNLPDDCFLPDGDHLNSNGAKIFTKHLVKYLKNIQFDD